MPIHEANDNSRPKTTDRILNYLSFRLSVPVVELPALLVLSNLVGKKVAIVIGSEGGFSQSEIDRLIGVNAKSISMGRRILRAETASIALTSVVMYMMGEWNYE